MSFLPDEWLTERLCVRTAEPADIAELRDAFNACSDLQSVDPTFSEVPEDEFRAMVARSLARAEGVPDAFHLQCIRRRETGECAGYLHLFYHHPRPSVVWISMFVLHPRHHSGGVGGEAVEGLAAQLRALAAYEAVWLRVFLKNLVALRFWIRRGFLEIHRYDGPTAEAPDTAASLVLVRTLDGVGGEIAHES